MRPNSIIGFIISFYSNLLCVNKTFNKSFRIQRRVTVKYVYGLHPETTQNKTVRHTYPVHLLSLSG